MSFSNLIANFYLLMHLKIFFRNESIGHPEEEKSYGFVMKCLVVFCGHVSPQLVFSVSSDSSLAEEGEGHRIRWQRSSANSSSSRKSPRNRKERRNRKRGRSSQDCRLERKEMTVRDLGLGYDSDEIVVFKYCVGTCMSARKNYDLALKVLTDNGSVSKRNVSTHPCCRPTRFETISFMDAQTSWQTIKWLSAANCSCVG